MRKKLRPWNFKTDWKGHKKYKLQKRGLSLRYDNPLLIDVIIDKYQDCEDYSTTFTILQNLFYNIEFFIQNTTFSSNLNQVGSLSEIRNIKD